MILVYMIAGNKQNNAVGIKQKIALTLFFLNK